MNTQRGTDRTVNERQRRQTERDRAAGIARVVVRVPAEHADQIRALAAAMRNEKPKSPEDTPDV
jgi:hypothetical protein